MGFDLGAFSAPATQSLVSNMSISKPFSWLTNNATGIAATGSIIGGLGSVYGAYSQAKASNKINKLNTSMYFDSKKRQKKADDSLNLAFANSTYSKG